jgi:signal transduction histidine kinase
MLLALALAWWLGRRVSRPLMHVATVAHQLREGDLHARAQVHGTEETQELARALNGLAERTGELLAAERAAVGDLSHRLRTPVTALRLDAEAVTDPNLAARLQEHIATLQVTIDAIVTEARRPVRTDLSATCDAAQAVRHRVAFWQVLAEDQSRPMHVDVPAGPLAVPLAEDDLTDVVDVLVDNVFHHTPEGAPFSVTLTAGVGTVHLVVEDGGPGVRTSGAEARQGSTGLGLDIVRRMATAVGGGLTIGPGTDTDHAPGTRVDVRLPLVEH